MSHPPFPARGVGRLLRPVVHPWMLASPDHVRGLADQLGAFRERYERVAERAGALLMDVPERTISDAPTPSTGRDAPAVRAAPIEDLGQSLRIAQEAFAGLADALAAHGPGLAERLDALDALPPTALRSVRLLRREIRDLTDALSDADVVARRRIEDAVRLVPDTAEVNRVGGWLRALRDVVAGEAHSGATAFDRGTAVDDEPTRRTLVRHESAARRVDELRDRLARMPSQDVATYLRTHPERLGELAEATSLLDVPDLAALADGDWPTSVHRVEAVRAAFAGLEPAAARRIALLYPRVVGALDGAPSALRIEANRLLVREALGRARRTDVELETRAIARRVADGRRWRRRIRAWAMQAWLSRDAITSVVAVDSDLPLLLRADLRIRIRLYQSLLFDRVAEPGPRPPERTAGASDPAAPGRRRRLLLFDPEGRGRIAELWGPELLEAEHVGVFVPGTGTAVRGFHLPTQVAADLAAADLAGTTAVIAWMGADFPYATANQAVFPGFACRAAVPLRDHVAGLDAPGRASVTVLGHSYGGVMVGAAERAGLACDRVVHVASPGAGPGVRGVADYPAEDPLGRRRTVHRFTLTAPGDPIRWVQAASPLWSLMRRLPWWRHDPNIGLGVDPARLREVTRLQAGVWELDSGSHRAGQPLRGPSAHAAVTAPGTQSLHRIAEVVAAPTPQRPAAAGP